MIQLVTPQCIQFMVKAGHTVMEVWTDMPGNGFIASIAGHDVVFTETGVALVSGNQLIRIFTEVQKDQMQKTALPGFPYPKVCLVGVWRTLLEASSVDRPRKFFVGDREKKKAEIGRAHV